MLLLAIVTAASVGCRTNRDHPGESADAAAAGSGYGVGRAGTNIMLGEKSPIARGGPAGGGDTIPTVPDAGTDGKPLNGGTSMARNSKNGSSLRKPGPASEDESWKTAPSRETTHDDPKGKDAKVRRARKPLENAPGLVPDPGRKAN